MGGDKSSLRRDIARARGVGKLACKSGKAIGDGHDAHGATPAGLDAPPPFLIRVLHPLTL